MKQSLSTQPAENKQRRVGDGKSQSHLMPGLIDPICNSFDHPRKHLTTRGIARQMGIAETFVVTAILRDTRRELTELRGMVSRIVRRQPDNVREFQMIEEIRRVA